MRIAIFSDLHNQMAAFKSVTMDAERRNVDQWLYLGDLGSDPALYEALYRRGIPCTFGNWEVSGLSRLSAQWAKWVAGWPAMVEIGDICYTHATPDMPAVVTTTAKAATYMSQGVGWGQLFPRLHNDEEARWAAYAALETKQQRAAFHGHTHLQQVWLFAGGRWRCFNGPAEFTLETGTAEQATRYLIGVGSAGEPQDGPELRYAIYDDADQSVQLLAIPSGES
jgi:predicted phosphodiesterase